VRSRQGYQQTSVYIVDHLAAFAVLPVSNEPCLVRTNNRRMLRKNGGNSRTEIER
jgi:hypothetical protein